MNSSPDHLELAEVDRPAPSSTGLEQRARYVDRLAQPMTQLDFIVNGVSLLQSIQTTLPPFWDARHRVVSVVDLVWPQDAAAGLRQLLGSKPRNTDWDVLAPGRLHLYVCGECADLYCSALTVTVCRGLEPDTGRDIVRWTQLRYEDGCTPATDMPDLTPAGPFTFDAEHYDATLTAPLNRLDHLTREEDRAAQAWKATQQSDPWWRRALHR